MLRDRIADFLWLLPINFLDKTLVNQLMVRKVWTRAHWGYDIIILRLRHASRHLHRSTLCGLPVEWAGAWLHRHHGGQWTHLITPGSPLRRAPTLRRLVRLRCVGFLDMMALGMVVAFCIHAPAPCGFFFHDPAQYALLLCLFRGGLRQLNVIVICITPMPCPHMALRPFMLGLFRRITVCRPMRRLELAFQKRSLQALLQFFTQACPKVFDASLQRFRQ
mmetsp:Transcript_9851/g.24506  ORF Transcript_9851/g.24506 Transcript_9851/m.24506 type:complete len:220 (-) Transcript_9851:123-782(-)